MRMVKETRRDQERISPNLRYLVLHADSNIIAEMVGYKNKELTGNRQPNWQRRILEKQKALYKQLEQ